MIIFTDHRRYPTAVAMLTPTVIHSAVEITLTSTALCARIATARSTVTTVTATPDETTTVTAYRTSSLVADHGYISYRNSGSHTHLNTVLFGAPSATELATRLAVIAPGIVLDQTTADAIAEHLGTTPTLRERTPLLDPEHRDHLLGLTTDALAGVPFYAIEPYLDAPNAAVVAKNAFGEANYHKPLARAVAGATPAAVAFYRHFADVIAPENLARYLDTSSVHLGKYLQQGHHELLDQLIAVLPVRLLERLVVPEHAELTQVHLREILTQMQVKSLTPEQVAQRLGQIKQRHLRSLLDVNGIVTSMAPTKPTPIDYDELRRRYKALTDHNLQRENAGLATVTWQRWQNDWSAACSELTDYLLAQAQAQQAQRQALELAAKQERHAQEIEWFTTAQKRWDGLTIGKYQLVFAIDADQLHAWGTYMHHCIHSYHAQLGFAVLAAIIDTTASDMPLLNLYITREGGLIQVLGKYNKQAHQVTPDAQQILDGLIDAGVPVNQPDGLANLRWTPHT